MKLHPLSYEPLDNFFNNVPSGIFEIYIGRKYIFYAVLMATDEVRVPALLLSMYHTLKHYRQL